MPPTDKTIHHTLQMLIIRMQLTLLVFCGPQARPHLI